MSKRRTMLDYSRRIERVADHIATHLDEPLELETLAAVACFSPYHFHRIYRGLMRETVADTLRRLRLHRAAGDLTRSERSMEEIAARAGYGSVAAFTRAFGADYGTPPAAYRRRFKERAAVPPVVSGSSTEAEEDAMYDVEFRTTEPLRLAAMRHRGPYMEIGSAFERLLAWAGGRGLLKPGTRCIGVYYGDPCGTTEADLVSDACIAVGPEVEGEGDVRIIELAGGRHAVILHKGRTRSWSAPMTGCIAAGCRRADWKPPTGPASRTMSTTRAACRPPSGSPRSTCPLRWQRKRSRTPRAPDRCPRAPRSCFASG